MLGSGCAGFAGLEDSIGFNGIVLGGQTELELGNLGCSTGISRACGPWDFLAGK